MYWSSRATESSLADTAPLACNKLADWWTEREDGRLSAATVASASASRLLQHKQTN